MKHRATGTAAYQGMFTLQGGPAYLHTALLLSEYEAKKVAGLLVFQRKLKIQRNLEICVYIYVYNRSQLFFKGGSIKKKKRNTVDQK